ncbi:hypothetical protein QEJ31_15690 [Pigmentibacter sp. JX0631]|uniref:hypothetical protein n=1 Tax=Pigmentibacter sp. JX0631 TaxID=2976982 RepID=UPI0024691354|nr:hypothetical protein [Pigmentibacter sp. JX0631]WGL59975.1 hypothetical protein QEJ31_15690 [Pigmentibacter sp. JX0631]
MLLRYLRKIKKIKITFFILIFSNFLMANAAIENSNVNDENNYENINLQIDSAIRDWQKSCANGTDLCNSKEIVFPGKATPLESSNNFRILIIDDSGMALAAYTRYFNRVLENLVEGANGEITTDYRSIEINSTANKILTQILNPEEHYFIPSEALKPNQELFSASLGRDLSNILLQDNSRGHSVSIFNFLANNNPQAQFLLYYDTQKRWNDIICNNALKDEYKLDMLKNLLTYQANTINKKVLDYNINFISLSEGIDSAYFNIFSKICPNIKIKSSFKKAVNKLYFDQFLAKLVENNNVLLVQANLSSSIYVDKNNSDFYSDCQVLKNRIRIGYVNSLSRDIPVDGIVTDKSKKYLLNGNENSELCTDIYINIAVEKQRPFNYANGVVEFSTFNVGTNPPIGADAVSSYATPIGLSFLLDLKMKHSNLSNAENIYSFVMNSKKGGKYIILDPALNKQLPIYTLKFLK